MLRNLVNNILKFCKIKIIESAVNVIAIDSAWVEMQVVKWTAEGTGKSSRLVEQ